MIHSLTDLKNGRWGLKVIFHILICIAIFWGTTHLIIYPINFFSTITEAKYPVLEIVILSLLMTAIFFSFIFIYIRKVLKLPLSEFRICRPKHIFIWLVCAVILPLFVTFFFTLLTPGIFTVSSFTGVDMQWSIASAVLYYGLAAGAMEELLFRGVIMRLLEIRWGKIVAVVLPSFVFALMHLIYGGPYQTADIFLVTIAGSCIGIMFSLIAIQSRSIWSCTIVHGIWNLVIIGELVEISASPSGMSIFTYTLKSDSILLTGGKFGIESSLPAIVLYAVVIVVILIWGRRKSS